jgi:hypothetical protein
MPIPGTPEALAAAERLRAAAEVVAECMDEGRDRVDVLRRLGLAIANLTEHDRQEICRRCGQPFSYSIARFNALRLSPPRHCFWCRQARRSERQAAGAASAESFGPEENT